jgi:hypothetical protein
MASLGGPTLHTPSVWTVVWAGDEALGTSLDRFHARLLADPYWTNAAGEYGVGAGAANGVLVLPGPAPATINDDGTTFAPLIESLVGTTSLGGATVPAPDDQTVFDFIIPRATTETYGYYHYETNQLVAGAGGGTLHVPYIVDRQDKVPGLNRFQYLTWSDSHELFETATDPHPAVAPGYQSAWLGGLGEVGDLCNDIYVEPRVYSGLLAAADTGDPCFPALSEPYYGVAPVPGLVLVPLDAAQQGSVSVELVPFSYGPQSPLSWSAYIDPASGFRVNPSSGVAEPGHPVTVTVSASPPAAMAATWFTVFVADPINPGNPQWGQEWVGAVFHQ